MISYSLQPAWGHLRCPRVAGAHSLACEALPSLAQTPFIAQRVQDRCRTHMKVGVRPRRRTQMMFPHVRYCKARWERAVAAHAWLN